MRYLSEVVVAARNEQIVGPVADAVSCFGYGVRAVGSAQEVMAVLRTSVVPAIVLESAIAAAPGQSPSWMAPMRLVHRLTRSRAGCMPLIFLMVPGQSQVQEDSLMRWAGWMGSHGVTDVLAGPSEQKPWTSSPERMLRLASWLPMRRPAPEGHWWTRRDQGAYRLTREAMEDIEHLYGQAWCLWAQARTMRDAEAEDTHRKLAAKCQSLAMKAARDHCRRLLRARMDSRGRRTVATE